MIFCKNGSFADFIFFFIKYTKSGIQFHNKKDYQKLVFVLSSVKRKSTTNNTRTCEFLTHFFPKFLCYTP